MKNNKIASIQAYLRWLLTQYQTLQQQQSQQDAYRIVQQNFTNEGRCKLTIQVIGKSITFKAYPEEIAGDDQMLDRFSRRDVRLITYYACQEIKKPKARIIWQEFCEKLNKMIFGIKRKDNEDLIKKTADQISLDKDLIDQLSQQDAHMIGYVTGSEQTHLEKIQMDALKSRRNDTEHLQK